jgi:superoxide dismutase
MPALQFGSRRRCLVDQRGPLAVAKIISGELPLTRAALPLFASDVCGQAYYVDYKSRRHNYMVAAMSRY